MFRGRVGPQQEVREREPGQSPRRMNTSEKFRASVGKNVTLSLFNRDNGIYLIIKKDLSDIKSEIYSSEAPILNSYLKVPEPFEFIVMDKDVINKEIEPINTALKIAFGDIREFQLETSQFVIGSSDENYVTIDQEDLDKYGVVPTINGMLNFVESNKESILGISNSRFEPDKGNIIFFDAVCREPDPDTASVQLRILSSVQQRGLSMQKKQTLSIIDMYIIIKARAISEPCMDFLRQLDIDLDLITMQRQLTINNWIEHEAEENPANLKAYLSRKYPDLTYTEIRSIVEICLENQLEFKVIEKVTELLNNLRLERRARSNRYEEFPFTKEEILASIEVACSYFGLKKSLNYPPDVNQTVSADYQKELRNI
jgi:hypothetical protein